MELQVGGTHYKKFVIQPIEFVHKNGIPFIEGSIIKYISRWRDKGGVQDLEKVKHYVDLLIELENAQDRQRKEQETSPSEEPHSEGLTYYRAVQTTYSPFSNPRN